MRPPGKLDPLDQQRLGLVKLSLVLVQHRQVNRRVARQVILIATRAATQFQALDEERLRGRVVFPGMNRLTEDEHQQERAAVFFAEHPARDFQPLTTEPLRLV